MVVRPDQKKEDGTYNVKFRLTHQRRSVYISTTHFVTKSQLDKNFNIKQKSSVFPLILKDLDKIRLILSGLSFEIEQYSINELLSFVNGKLNINQGPVLIKDFFIEVIDSFKTEGTKKCYYSILSKVLKCFGDNVTFADITYNAIIQFECYLRKKGNNDTTINYAMTRFSYIFKLARNKYNDEERDIVLIKNPFSRYKAPQCSVPLKRAWSYQQFYEFIKRDKSILSDRRQLACDVVIISFLLCGINSADIYELSYPKNGYLYYNRKKTRNIRRDKAEMRIKVQPELVPYLKKYEDPTKQRAFNFYNIYPHNNRFSSWICGMIKHIRKILSIPNLTTYVARHTWATVAFNDLHISKDEIALCLIHSSDHKMTDFYIKPDFNLVDKINRRVIDWVYYNKK